jgi:4-carboxymuconolactone decarboxylase
MTTDRMPPLPETSLDDAQRAAAAELIAGPRKAVKGPFIPLLRSPGLLAHVQKVGAYLRFDSALPPRLSEFATLVVAREWTQQFEWFAHVPLALAAGTSQRAIDALHDGRRPAGTDMSDDEAMVYDFSIELTQHHGVSDASYRAAVERLGERGVVDLVGLIGYFTTISMVLNVARTPPEVAPGTAPRPAFPR